MRRINLLRAHGSPTLHHYTHHACRCGSCRAAAMEMRAGKAGQIRDEKHAYYASHKEERRAYDATYRDSHRGERRASHAAYYADHEDEWRAYGAAYYADHREDVHREHAAFTEWLQILRTVNGCEDCETHEGWLEHHHVDPDTKKYKISHMYSYSLDALEDELEKCVVLCRSCHRKRHVVMKHESEEVACAV